MKIRPTVITLAALGLGSGLLLGAAPASAAAPSNGCPSGYELLSVAALAELGYQVPTMVDDPTGGIDSFGNPGNGDGWVCARPLGNLVGPYGQIYNFMDNQLP